MIRPLSTSMLAALECLARDGATPTQHFNPGVVGKLVRDRLAVLGWGANPYPTARSKACQFLVITEDGRERLHQELQG